MTAKFLNNYPARNAVRVIRNNKKFLIVTSVLQLLGIPLMMITGLMELYTDKMQEINEDYPYFSCGAFVGIGGFCLGIAVLMGMFCGIRAYEEEWSKTKVDMLYALPLNGKQRFFSNYAGGLAMYLIPYLVAVVIGWAALLIMTPVLLSISRETTFEQEFFEAYLYYFLASAGLFLLMWMYYTISALVASCCGTMFENIYTNLLLNILVPGTFAAVLAVVTDKVFGLEFEYSWDFIGFTSPIGGLIYLIYLIETKSDVFEYYGYSESGVGGQPSTQGLIPAYLKWALVIILLTVGILILAWKFYEHRKAEQVGKPFIYIWIYYVILTALAICILCLVAVDDDFAIAAVLFSAIVYFIMEVIRKRGFKKFWLSIVTYIVTVVVTIGFFVVAVHTECFGRMKYVPADSLITCAELEFMGDDSSYDLYYQDKETISKITEFHREYLKNHEKNLETIRNTMKEYPYGMEFQPYNSTNVNDYYYYNEDSEYIPQSDLTIVYETVTGSVIHRSYQLCVDEYLDMIKIVAGTDSYAEASSRRLYSRIKSHAKVHSSTETYIPDSFMIDIENTSQVNELRVTITGGENALNHIREAYQNDMKHLTFENFTNDIVFYIYEMPVYETFTETMNAVGYNLRTGEGKMQSDAYHKVEHDTSYANNYTLRVKIVAPEDYAFASAKYGSFRVSVFENNANPCFKKQEQVYEDTISDYYQISKYPELEKLIAHAKPYYCSMEKCYLLYLNGTMYIIPPEDNELVKQIIQKDSYYYFSKTYAN